MWFNESIFALTRIFKFSPPSCYRPGLVCHIQSLYLDLSINSRSSSTHLSFFLWIRAFDILTDVVHPSFSRTPHCSGRLVSGAVPLMGLCSLAFSSHVDFILINFYYDRQNCSYIVFFHYCGFLILSPFVTPRISWRMCISEATFNGQPFHPNLFLQFSLRYISKSVSEQLSPDNSPLDNYPRRTISPRTIPSELKLKYQLTLYKYRIANNFYLIIKYLEIIFLIWGV